jgi:hypothetical protein
MDQKGSSLKNVKCRLEALHYFYWAKILKTGQKTGQKTVKKVKK